jgi:hypothetical protein
MIAEEEGRTDEPRIDCRKQYWIRLHEASELATRTIARLATETSHRLVAARAQNAAAIRRNEFALGDVNLSVSLVDLSHRVADLQRQDENTASFAASCRVLEADLEVELHDELERLSKEAGSALAESKSQSVLHRMFASSYTQVSHVVLAACG